MHDLPPELGLYAWLVLGLATAVIVGVTALAGRCVRSAVWQRTLWQGATLGLLLLVALQATGTGPALVRLCRMRTGSEATAVARSQDAGQQALRDLVPHSPAGDGVPLLRRSSVPEAATTPPLPGQPAAQARATEPRAEGAALASTIEPPASPTCGAESGMRLDNRAGPQTAVEPPSPARSCWPEAVWAFGAVAVALRAAWARMFLGRFRRRCRPACDEAVLGRVRRLAARLGLRRPVRVLVADRLVAPVVFGSLRPAIALPVRFGHDFDERQQEAVLAHEMAHLAAGDPAWYFLAGLVCALLWWHPLAWWSRGRLRAASEALADEASLLVPDGPSLLAASLVAVGRRLLGPRRLGWISIEGNGFRSGLGRRVERLMKLRPRPWRSPRRGRAVCVKTALTVALACVAVSCTAWAQPQAPSIEGGTTMSVLRTSWRCSLAAAALWAMTGPSGGNVADGQPPAKPAPDQGSTRPSDRPRDDDLMKQRQKLYEQVQAVRSDLRDHPDSKELQATLQTLMDQMKALPRPGAGPGAGGPGRPDGRGDLENKISHLRAAAENLRAAGMGEQADGILRMVERMRAAQREGMAPGRPGPGGPPPRDGMGPGPGGPPPRDGQGPGRYSPGGPSPREGMGPGGPEGAPREIMELRTEVQEMRREMRELRDQVKHLVENQRSDRK